MDRRAGPLVRPGPRSGRPGCVRPALGRCCRAGSGGDVDDRDRNEYRRPTGGVHVGGGGVRLHRAGCRNRVDRLRDRRRRDHGPLRRHDRRRCVLPGAGGARHRHARCRPQPRRRVTDLGPLPHAHRTALSADRSANDASTTALRHTEQPDSHAEHGNGDQGDRRQAVGARRRQTIGWDIEGAHGDGEVAEGAGHRVDGAADVRTGHRRSDEIDERRAGGDPGVIGVPGGVLR